jgi:hypothetical protein
MKELPVRIREIRRFDPASNGMPPVSVQMKNAGAAALRVGMALMRGEKIARTPQQMAACLEICTGCPQWDPTARRCRQCGCFGGFKSWITTEKCPLDKWPKFDIAAPAECPPATATH